MGNSRDGYENVAFSMPGGETSDTCRLRPIDLAHLSRHTMGDREVETEVLALFLDQAQAALRQIDGADVEGRLFLLHALKGAALSVGAFPIAGCVANLERNPSDHVEVERLGRMVGEASDFIASIDR